MDNAHFSAQIYTFVHSFNQKYILKCTKLLANKPDSRQIMLKQCPIQVISPTLIVKFSTNLGKYLDIYLHNRLILSKFRSTNSKFTCTNSKIPAQIRGFTTKKANFTTR